MSATASNAEAPLARWRIEVCGTVQGVGFRPFVHRLAQHLGVRGSVRNIGGRVVIDAAGTVSQLEALLQALRTDAPPLAHVATVTRQSEPLGDPPCDAPGSGFFIAPSEHGAAQPVVPPDVAACSACLAEVLDPADRRHRYPFTNCTDCGPRFSLITGLPYDRAQTTMARFTMCPACRVEYEDPANRRFHAQPNACWDCGPRVTLLDSAGKARERDDEALTAAAAMLRAGRIVAVKGLGGFHLMVDATNESAVRRLRARKHRPAKPLALMVRDRESAARTVALCPTAQAAMVSPQAPIVLAPRAAQAKVAPSVAPGNPELGVMLAYTPLHRLLLAELPEPVVATSGNRAEEPICIDEAEALVRLRDIADAFLVHDRPIARAVDDSVVRVMAGKARVLRRARGYAPVPIALASDEDCNGVLATGGHLKTTVALGVGGQAVLSQHIGDLETPEAVAAHERAARDLPRFFELEPRRFVCDLHPDYRSTHLAEASGKPVMRVQHHLAHVLACMAEHGVSPRRNVLGVAWDGTGYGPDGTVWGGEWFHLCQGRAQRVATFRTFALPGGEQAVREPWRAAAGVLYELEAKPAHDTPVPFEALARAAMPRQRVGVRAMLERKVNSPRTSSAGRLFDAAAALLGLVYRNGFEGEAAMALEACAAGAAMTDDAYVFGLNSGAPMTLDWAPAFEALLADRASGTPPAICAARLHRGLIEAIVTVAREIGEPEVVLSGGCFQNRILLEGAGAALSAAGFTPRMHETVPPNDGGLALGQLYALAKGVPACV